MPLPCASSWCGSAVANRQIAISVRGMMTSPGIFQQVQSEANHAPGSSVNVGQPSATQSRASAALASVTSASLLADLGLAIGTA